MYTPSIDDIAVAIEWLEANEGDGDESDSCAVVAAWLKHQRIKLIRREATKVEKQNIAKDLGISVAKLERCRRGIDPWPR